MSKNIFEENMNGYCDFMEDVGINYSNFPQEFFEIVSLFAEDCNFNLKSVYIHHNRLFIMGRCKGQINELMLRFGNYRLIVARVEFIHQRQGKMTRLYKILKKIRKKYKLNPITIEQCMTEASRNWSIKNRFVPVPYTDSFVEPK